MLQKQTDYYSHNPNADRIVQVQGEIDEVKKVMVENIGMHMKCACAYGSTVVVAKEIRSFIEGCACFEWGEVIYHICLHLQCLTYMYLCRKSSRARRAH